jgi:DNA-binding MarR family transcriptional regulator
MTDFSAAELLPRLIGGIDALRSGMPEMPATWLLVLLKIAGRPACSTAWLCQELDLAKSVVNRIAQELGSSKSGALGLLDTVDDPLDPRRKLHALTAKGRAQIEEALSAIAGAPITYEEETAQEFEEALAERSGPPLVRVNYFSPSQLGTIKLAAERHDRRFVGKNVVAFPLAPARSVIGPHKDARGKDSPGLAHWVENEGKGRWIEMETVYAAEGGVGVADFDDPNDAFRFVLAWRGAHPVDT